MSQRVEKSKSLLSDELQINWLSEMPALLRFDWLHCGNSLAEVRQLGLPDINQRRRGVLTAIYYHISKNLSPPTRGMTQHESAGSKRLMKNCCSK